MPATAGRDPDDTPEEGAEADAASRSGRARIFGDYRILREVGRGGMGVVYEAWQISMGRRVALKVLSHGLGDPCRRRRFEREARSAGRLHHTNIVPVFGFGEHQGTPYYVMQYIRGVGLDAVLNDGAAATGRLAPTEAATASSAVAARGSATRDELEVSEPMSAGFGVDPREIVDGPDPSACPWGWTEPDGLERSPPRIAAEGLDPESTDPPFPRSPAGPADGPERWKWTARLGVQAAGGLDHAHSQGVLHRDVKPSNLLLDEHGILWLTDFGLAKLDDDHDLTRSGVVVGTLRYMPPEALDGVHGRAGDVYGLGLTLYELLARRPAFDGVDRARLLWQVSQTTPPPLRKLDRRIPLDLATVVHKAIERRPADRYATAAELAADLARFLEDRPILARRASAAERYWRWARRNPSVAVLGAILTAVLVLATVASLAAARRFREQADDQRLLAEAARRAGAEEAEARRGAQRALRELQAARDEEDRTLYDTRASLAGAAWAADDYGQYRALLELMRPTLGKDDARGWEWRYLTGLDSEASRSVGGPDDSFAAVATRPDGSEFATADFHGVIRIWRTDDGGPRRTIRAANSSGRLYDLRAGVQALAYSPDGRLLAGPGGDGAVAVYDAETGDRLRLLGDPSLAVLALAFSPDGSRLAAGLAGHTFRIWDVDADAPAIGPDEPHGGPVSSVDFGPDGKTLATASFDGAVRIWTLDPVPKLLRAWPAHQREAHAAAFSPDGARLASAGLDGAVRIWETASGKLLTAIAAHAGGAYRVAWSSDGAWLASAGNDNAVRIWDPADGRLLHRFLGHSEGIHALSADRDGRLLVSASPEGLAKVWDARSPARPRTLQSPTPAPYGGEVACVAISGDGRLVAAGRRDRDVAVWDAATGALLHRFKTSIPGVRALAFSPDGGLLVASCGDPSPPSRGEAVVWRLADERPIATYREHREVVDALVFLDDRRVASGGGDDRIHVWDSATAAPLLTLKGHTEAVRELALSRDGRTLASGDDDGFVRLWDARTGSAGALLPAGGKVLALAFSHDGRELAAAVRGGSILVWDPSRPVAPPRRLDDRARDVLALVFTPDGRLISGGVDKAVHVWDVEGGRSILALQGHGATVTGLALARDGGRLASSSGDHTVKLWDAPRVEDPVPDQPAASAQ